MTFQTRPARLTGLERVTIERMHKKGVLRYLISAATGPVVSDDIQDARA
jgi:hypothetical protein